MEHKYNTITTSDEFKDTAWDLQKRPEQVLLLPVSGKVRYIHAVRFAEKKYVMVEGVSPDAQIVIPLEKSHHPAEGHQDFKNETQFFYGGDDESRYVFRNLTISVEIESHHKPDEEIELGDELLLMDIMHNSKVCFMNCKFVLDAKKYHIRLMHDATCEFYGCDIPANLVFDTLHQGKYKIC